MVDDGSVTSRMHWQRHMTPHRGTLVDSHPYRTRTHQALPARYLRGVRRSMSKAVERWLCSRDGEAYGFAHRMTSRLPLSMSSRS
jgi:hypothetical protein